MSQNISTYSTIKICVKCGTGFHDIVGEPRDFCTISCEENNGREYIKKGGSRMRKTLCKYKNCKMCKRMEVDFHDLELISLKI